LRCRFPDVQDLIQTEWAWTALVGSAVLLPDEGRRRSAAAGLGGLVLALGALRVGGGRTPLPAGFAAVELALFLVGLGVVAAVVLPQAPRGRLGAAGAALLVIGIALLFGAMRALARAAPVGATLAAVGVVAGIATLAWVGAGALLRRLHPPGDRRDAPTAARWVLCAAAGVLLAAAGPHVLLILGGVFLAAVAVGADGLRRRQLWSLAIVGVTLAALVPAAWLLGAVAGDRGLATGALSDLPLSPAAETLLAPLVLLAAWSVSGLWPMARSPLAGLAGLAGVFLLARLAVPALPEGLDHWRPLVYPVLGIMLWQATASRRWAAALIGGALFALVSGSTSATPAAWWLGAGALIAGGAEHLAPRRPSWLWCPAALAAGLGALPATAAGLEAEVVYTTLAVAVLALLLAAGRGARRRVDSSPGQIHISRFGA
jgi:hypothetical protein